LEEVIFIGKKAPIVFFTYNRPEHTRLTLESLTANEGASESELFIFCDGSESEEDVKAVKEVRSLTKSRKWCGKVNITERDKNMGLAGSIIEGVTEIVNRYGRAIVLEDDLVLSPQFLNFMNDALEVYKNVPKVMHISGYMFPVKGKLPETFFYRATSCWGWATWKRAWVKFEPNSYKLLTKIKSEKLRWRFDIEGLMNYYNMLKRQAKGEIDSWAIRWYASVFLNGGLCLHPGKSLVNNIGHDGTGVHCGSTGAFDVKVSKERISNYTHEIRESEQIVRLMVSFYRALNKSFPAKVINKLKQIFIES
jgi:hypothetical protein